MKDYFLLAVGNLKHRGLRSWLTLLGILIGITAVVALVMLGDGLRMAVNGQFGVSATEVISVQAGGLNAYGPPGSGVVNPLTVEDIKDIEKIDSVKSVLRRNLPPGQLEFNDRVIFGYAINVPSGDGRVFAYEALEIEPEVGRLLKDSDTNYIMLGNNFLTDNVGLGKPVRVGNKIAINGEDFEVIGIMKKKGSFIFDNIVYMNEEPLKDLMGYGDTVDIIVVRVKDKSLMEETKLEIEKVLRRTRNVKEGEEDFEVTTPEAMLSTVNNILGGIQAFILVIASVSIIVGAVGIVNTMTTSVLERRKEIGIMKAIGAKNSQVFLQFFIESGLLGLIGGLIGILLGGLIGFAGISGLNQFLGSEAVPNMNFLFLGSVLFGSFIIGAMAGIAPALQAAHQDPVEALRG
ncbi:ABC transporter permease [archaeon]|nr:ABC transporter permease [archaeon]